MVIFSRPPDSLSSRSAQACAHLWNVWLGGRKCESFSSVVWARAPVSEAAASATEMAARVMSRSTGMGRSSPFSFATMRERARLGNARAQYLARHLAPPFERQDCEHHHQHRGEAKPSDGILQVIVAQLDFQRCGMRHTARRNGGLLLDVERR